MTNSSLNFSVSSNENFTEQKHDLLMETISNSDNYDMSNTNNTSEYSSCRSPFSLSDSDIYVKVRKEQQKKNLWHTIEDQMILCTLCGKNFCYFQIGCNKLNPHVINLGPEFKKYKQYILVLNVVIQ